MNVPLEGPWCGGTAGDGAVATAAGVNEVGSNMMRSLADCLEVGLEEPVDVEDDLSERLRATEPKILFSNNHNIF